MLILCGEKNRDFYIKEKIEKHSYGERWCVCSGKYRYWVPGISCS